MLHVGLRLFICLNLIISVSALAEGSRSPASLGSYAAKLSVGTSSHDINPELFRKEAPPQAKAEQERGRLEIKPLERGPKWGQVAIPAYY